VWPGSVIIRVGILTCNLKVAGLTPAIPFSGIKTLTPSSINWHR